MVAQDLFVAVQTPALGTGQGARVVTLLRALVAAGRRVHVLHVPFGADEPAPSLRALPGLDVEAVEPSRSVRRAVTYARARAARVPGDWARAISPELVATASKRAASPGVERVIADGPAAAAALRGLARRRPVVYNAHNLESAYRHELADSGLGSRRALREAERRLIEAASESWMVSERDLAGARELCPAARLRLVPNVVDVAGIEPVVVPASGGRLLMVADFTYEPNRNGLRFLLDRVLEHVWERRPDVVLRLVGRGLDDFVADDPRVEVTGFVDDLRAQYAAAACVVVPLLEGGGTPFKFLEAMAYGLPVVATPRAAAGLAVIRGEHYAEGADGPGFAEGVLAVMADGDEATAMAARGRALVAERYSLEALVRAVAA